MASRKKKADFDSEKHIQCFYCGTSMRRKGLADHTANNCSKANGRKPREKVSKGQKTLDFFQKKVLSFFIHLR